MKFFFFLVAIFSVFCGLHANAPSQIDVQKINEILEELYREKHVEKKGADSEIRPTFIAVQAIIEQKITARLGQTIKIAVGCIHAPMPATPFCMDIGQISSKELISPSVQASPMTLGSMLLRARGLREYLSKGGVMLVVYPKGGLEKRTKEQQTLYRKTLEQFKSNLLDRPLACDIINSDLIGATYIFQNEQGEKFLFSIKMTQANDPQEMAEYSLWLGPSMTPSFKRGGNRFNPFLLQRLIFCAKIARISGGNSSVG